MIGDRDDPRAAQALDEMETRLREGELRLARRALDATRALCGPGERARFEALEERLGLLERLEGPTLDHDAAMARGDLLAARDAAARAASVAGGEEATLWRARAEDAGARVRAEWRIREAELDGGANGAALAPCAGVLEPTLGEALPVVADDGATLVLVAAWERWVFVREVDVRHRRLRRIGWLRTPEPLDEVAVQVEGNSIHLVGSAGHLLSLSRRPLEVLRWISLRPFMLPDRSVSDAFVTTSGRYLWAQLKEPYEQGGLVVIDLDEWRVCARLHGFGSVHPVAGAHPARMVATTHQHAAGLHDEQGGRVAAPSLDGLEIVQLVAHPDGAGLVALVAAWGPETHDDEDDDDDEPSLGLVELRPGRTPSAPLILPGTHHEQLATLAVSLAARRLFLLTELDGKNQIVAYRPAPAGLEEAWRVEVPELTTLARDPASRTVLALAPATRGLEIAVLGPDPVDLDASPLGHLELGRDEPPFPFCAWGGQMERAEFLLHVEATDQIRAGNLERWAETARRQRRKDPAALAMLVGAVLSRPHADIAERLLAISLDQHPGHPELVLRQADVAATRERWDEVERLLAGLEDLVGARSSFEDGAELSRSRCFAEWNLDLAGALSAPPDAEPDADGSPLRQLVRVCRLADQHMARGDAGAARDVLDRSVVHVRLELESAARLAEAHLAHAPRTPVETLAKLEALSRIAGYDPQRPRAWSQIPGLGWDTVRLAALAARARAWLDEHDRPAADPEPRSLPPPAAERPEPPPPPVAPPAPHEPHHLPPLGHEVMGRLVPGLAAAVGEAVRYVRAQPGWDDTQTLGEDLRELEPLTRFLRANLADEDVSLLATYLDCCVNFELGRRKAFFVDGPVAWLLAHTNLDIEGRVLRLPFSCFALVFTDRATLELAEAVLPRKVVLQIMTAYVRRSPAPRGAHGLRVSLVVDDRSGTRIPVIARDLRFSEDDDIDAILAGTGAGRALLHVVVSAILYATSANVRWPIAPSPIRALRARAAARGKAKKARVAHRAHELAKEYSGEDVFFLPGRIPNSQLRALQHVEREPTGEMLMARFLVRGHWRRAARGWVDQRVRWIEPYWKGPELGPIIEKEYRLKI